MNEIYLAYKASRDSSDHLEHHGIKGQKWGVRRFQNPDGTRIGAKKRKPKPAKEPEPASKKVHPKYKEKADTLDDDELNKRIRRMENELKYNKQQDLLYPDKKRERRERIKKAISDALTDSVRETVKSAATTLGKRAINAIFGIEDGNKGGNKNSNKNGDKNENKDKNKDKDKDKNSNDTNSDSSQPSNEPARKTREQRQQERQQRQQKRREENEAMYRRAAQIANQQETEYQLSQWQRRIKEQQKRLRAGKYKFHYYG